MAELPGSIRIELIPEMKQYVSGSTFVSTLNPRGFNTKEGIYRPILDEIKKIQGVKDVWFTDEFELALSFRWWTHLLQLYYVLNYHILYLIYF
ncbi:MAG: hypothetical protein WAM42_18855 [Candidatus Nitrosopolaris sp.]